MTEAYPLKWPEGWPRTPANQQKDSRYQFKVKGGEYGRVPISFEVARRGLCEELDKLKASHVVISSNIPLRADGMPRAVDVQTRMPDPGIAIYFRLKGRAMVMAQDRYDAPSANIRSLSLAIEAMRQLERHGGGTMMHKAFDGFAALPPPGGMKPARPWWEVLRYQESDRELLSVREVEARFTTLAKRAHPDAGGTTEAMSELNVAKDAAVAEIGA